MIQSGTEGEINGQFSWSRAASKEGTRSVDQGTSRDWCCACSFRQRIRKGNRHSKALRVGAGADRGCTKGALVKGSGKGWCTSESCSYTWQTDTLGSRAQEDGRCTKGSMGEGEGGEEDGLANDRGPPQDRVLTRHAARRTIRFKTLVGNHDTQWRRLGACALRVGKSRSQELRLPRFFLQRDLNHRSLGS